MRKLITFEICLTLLVILGGAFVRATGSGAGCGEHWPLCNGVTIPVNPKIETVIEFSHRISSGLSLLLFVAIYFLLRRKFPKAHGTRSWSNVALASFLIEAGIGALLVLKKLVATDTSYLRALVIALHLVNTYILLAGLTGILWNLAQSNVSFRDLPAKTRALFAGWGLVGAMGAIVALGDTLFPAQSLAHGFAQEMDATSHPLIRLRILHPLIALLITVLTLLATLPAGNGNRPFAWPVRALLMLQLALGISNWLLLAPVPLQLTHLLLANVSWIAVVWFSLANARSGTHLA